MDCLIISGGAYSKIGKPAKGTFVIACDHGYEYAWMDGIVPDLVIGDFDSYQGKLPEDIPVRKLNCEKDDTDTMDAIREALQKGCKNITITCALGLRLDHTFANLQSAAFATMEGATVQIVEASERIYFVKDSSISLDAATGYSLSVFAFSKECVGVSIQGAKYPLDHYHMVNSYPIGVSNEWKEPTVKISVEQGLLMIVLSKLG
ncbi:MAG TPA: thiamine diphosphokinase [Lachnospiraceae bacterium]|nr:thiamine diphosphokinase [Lachnospiraceae bacterium]HPF29997.1 thiamine diphosphokinase [Lachnospiraceae bacterium]